MRGIRLGNGRMAWVASRAQRNQGCLNVYVLETKTPKNGILFEWDLSIQVPPRALFLFPLNHSGNLMNTRFRVDPSRMGGCGAASKFGARFGDKWGCLFWDFFVFFLRGSENSAINTRSCQRRNGKRAVAQLGRALASGARSRRFESCQPDHFKSRVSKPKFGERPIIDLAPPQGRRDDPADGDFLLARPAAFIEN